MKPEIKRLILSLCIILVLGLLIRGIVTSVPSDRITIYSGAVGGTYYQLALKYRDVLTSLGFEVTVLPTNNTEQVIGSVNKGQEPNSIGFMIGQTDAAQYPNIRSLGFIGIEPLFIFYNSAYGKLVSLATLKGRAIVMPPEDSVTTQMALKLLSLYDINPQNTKIEFLPFRQAVAALQSGDAYSLFLMLGAEHALIEKLMQDLELDVFSYSDTKGILSKIKDLKSVAIASGSYDVLRQIPPQTIDLLAGQIEIITNQNLDKAAAYALLNTFENIHHGASLTHAEGAYPAFVGAIAKPHETVQDFAKSGTPWLYRTFPNAIAVLIDKYLIIGLGIFLLTEIYRSLRYLYEFLELTAQAMALSIIKRNRLHEKLGKQKGVIAKVVARWAEGVVNSQSIKQKATKMLTENHHSA
jgi:TRAP-type uncharacterized transport system substrate-binding protein